MTNNKKAGIWIMTPIICFISSMVAGGAFAFSPLVVQLLNPENPEAGIEYMASFFWVMPIIMTVFAASLAMIPIGLIIGLLMYKKTEAPNTQNR